MCRIRVRLSFLLALVVLATCLSTLSVMAVSGSWYENSGRMSGYVTNDAWWETRMHRIKGASNASTFQHPQYLVQTITVTIIFKDRCQYANGTWAPWQQLASNAKGVSWATTTGEIYAQGQYQNCMYGHQYRNESVHVFVNSSTGLNTTKNLSESY